MDLVLFKERYPNFTDDKAISVALGDAQLLITGYNIDEGKRDLALIYLTAHLLSVPQGASEPQVTRVKADTVEVSFSDKQASNDWLSLTSYGRLLALLINPEVKTHGYGIVKDCDPGAINFGDRISYDGSVIKGGRECDKCYFK